MYILTYDQTRRPRGRLIFLERGDKKNNISFNPICIEWDDDNRNQIIPKNIFIYVIVCHQSEGDLSERLVNAIRVFLRYVSNA